MTYEELEKHTNALFDTIKKHGGTIQGGINWTWADFDDPNAAAECFEAVKNSPAIHDHRGLYKTSFRFR